MIGINQLQGSFRPFGDPLALENLVHVPPEGRRSIPLRDVTLPHECPQPLRMRVLGRAPYFADLETHALERVDKRMRTRVFSAESHIYQAGDKANALYVVAEGRVKLSHLSAGGTETLTDILGPGELFGAMSSLGEPLHLNSAQALVDSCILRIGQTEFRQILEENPKVALRVLDDLARRLRQAHSDVGSQTTHSVKQRVAIAVLRLADKLGQRDDQGVLLNVPLSRADLAGLARSTPESVSRIMSQWKKDGVIDSGRRWTRILNPDFLEKVAQES